MAFCVNCGAQLADSTKFCNKCGAALAAGPAAPAGAASGPAPTPVPSQGSNTVLKIILGLLAVFVFLGLLVAGSCVYIGYRVKKRAHEFTQEIGANAAPYKGPRRPCMLSKAEVADALGQPVASVEQLGIGSCTYNFGPNGANRLSVEFTWQGGAMTMGLTHGAMRQISGGTDSFTAVPDIGDEAYIAPMGSALMMRKGDVMVNIDLRTNGVDVEAAKKIAAKIADHL